MLWVKEPNEPYESVTGTVRMVADDHLDDPESQEANDDDATVQIKQTSKGIILNPQPQDNPNDPLNWPVWRRDVSLLIVTIYALLAGGMTPLLAPVMKTLETQFDKPFTSLTYLVGVLMASMGVGSALLAPIAVKYGKRPVYLIALLIFLGGLIWGAKAHSYNSLMGARVLAGLGASPAESLPSTTIAEIYFVHERAYRLGIYTLLLLGGKNLSPLVSAFTSNRLGWNWIFWVAAIICGAVFLGMLLFVHETWWDRTPIPDKRSQEESRAAKKAREVDHRPPFEAAPEDIQLQRRLSNASFHTVQPYLSCETTAQSPQEKAEKDDESASASEAYVEPPQPKRVPFFRNLGIYSGEKTDTSLGIIFIRPFVLYAYIPVVFSTLIYSTSVVWLSVIAETINTIFNAPPYNFRPTSVGLLYVATFIGGTLGSVVAGKGSDLIVRWMCYRNHGIYEPEFRLVMILPVMVSVTIGLMGFGWSTWDKDHWIVPAVFLGILGFGTSLASTVAITYVVDCYRKLALEALVSFNFAKNILGLVFSIFVPYFFESSGAKTTYVVYGSVQVGLCLFAIPLYRYGKIIRHFHDEHNVIERLYKHDEQDKHDKE